MSVRRFRLQVRNAALQMVAPLDTFTYAEVVPKFNPVSLETCGTFLVQLPMRRQGERAWNPAAVALLEDGAGITSSLDGKALLSGLVETPERSRSGSGAERLEVFGYSDDSLLAVRNAWPVPSSDLLSAQDGQSYDVRNGNAETVIKAYVNANAGPAAPIARRAPALTIQADAGLGSAVRGRARFYNLAEHVSDLCSQGGGLGWRVRQSGLSLVFEVFAPRDRSKHARFSPALRNLESYRFARPKRKVTRAIAAGGGQGVNRLFQESKVSSAWHEYRESYIDRRDAGGGADQVMTTEERAAAVAELLKAAQDAVEKGVSPTSFTAPVQDTPAVGFMREYGPLDKVTVSVAGTSFVDVVRQVSIRADASGLRILPTIGFPDQTVDDALIRRLRDTERRLARIERGQ